MYPEESWKDYLHRSEKLLENARIMGATIDDEEFIYSVNKGLPQKYNIIAMQINTMNNPTLSDIKSQFSLYQERYHEKDISSSSAYKASQSESKKIYPKNKFKYKPKCYICNKRGHRANDCWHKLKNKGNDNRREDLNKPSTSGYKSKFRNQQKQTGNSHNEKAANCLIAKNQEKSEQEWIIDSGATSHMTSCFELFKNSENKERKIILADDTQIESKAIGNVKIKTKEENLPILKDVLFVPQIKGNLLKPFKRIEKIQTSQSLELLHTDLIGPIKEESIGKARFILTIVDDYSRKLFTRFLKAKSETQEILKEFIEYIENTTNKRIKKFRSDNGTEFNNQELESYLKRKGIEHQRTTFFPPAQNGRCERANRSLIEGTRAQLIESGLPIKFRAEAMNTYKYLKNRTPSYHNTNKTPEEMFIGRKPTVSHLKIDGPAEEETNSSSGDEETSVEIQNPALNSRYNFRHTHRPCFYYEPSLSEEEYEENSIIQAPNDTLLMTQYQNHIPKTYKEAIECPQASKWTVAMKKEINSLLEHHVWDIEPLPKGTKPIKSKWIFTIKNDPIIGKRYKARLVAAGYSQKYGNDYYQTFSPVICSVTLRILLCYAAMQNYDFKNYDIETAYLYGDLQGKQYMLQPEGFEMGDKNMVCKLKKAIYCLHQSAKVFYDTLKSHLLDEGFKNLTSDKCVFIYEKNNSKIFLGIYVDDILAIYSD
ncbi:hypothetical protein LAZ67_11002175 [Cordylochernes scorpioides]|uniref:Retrovirus-related Pol polyprotein from transposon TNT 1-94 n=1 Tax=Cordylochernes scorpioides TaxID=51811 RepID=A0ABY6L2X0_9ARAC|nr:hypothetical protein LAZ67_11002175 [Cordylochernes scorpioides]